MNLKAIILASIVSITSGIQTAQAQTGTGGDITYTTENPVIKKLRFGVFVAPTLSWMKPTTEKDGDQRFKNDGSKLGFTYGLIADYNFADNYTLATGIQINSTGGNIATNLVTANPATGSITSTKYNYYLQYLEIPLALKLRSDIINKFTFFGQFGLTMGINISRKATYTVVEKGTTDDIVYQSESKEKIKGGIGAIAPVLFQMNIGAGIQYQISNKLDFYTAIFFNNGFAPDVTNPTKYDNTPAFKDGNVRLNNLALRVGLFF